MGVFEAIIIAVIEGFTEYLPVSSTGHMIVANEILGFERNANTQSYEIIVQFAAILAIVTYYKRSALSRNINTLSLVIASLPILTVGFLFADFWRGLFDPIIVAWMFIIGGVIFILVEYFYSRVYEGEMSHEKMSDDISLRQSFFIGLVQMFSLIPGTSRSGATIIGGLMLGLSRERITIFSFLLAIPVITIVTFYQIFDEYEVLLTMPFWPLVIGFCVSYIVSYLAIMFLVRFIATHSFVIFGWYRILFGLFLLFFLL